MTDSETTSQERFVIAIALIAGLLFFAWLLAGTSFRYRFFSCDKEKEETTIPAAAVAIALDDTTSRIETLEKRITGLDQSLEFSLKANEAAQHELKKADHATATALQAEIEERTQEITLLKERVATLENKDETLRVELLKRIQLLELQLARLRSTTAESRLFVENGDSLSGKSAELFRRLLAFSRPAPELATEYAGIETQLLARPVVRIKYGLAESEVPAAALSRLEQLVSECPEGTFFLVVGYADQTGDPAANRTLSAKRSTNAADVIDRNLKPGQTARAIYLGQTTRFGPDEENRVVEIWSILP